MCHCNNTGVKQTLSKCQHRKLTWEKKILPLLLPGFELATFQSWVWCSTNKLSWRTSSIWHPLLVLQVVCWGGLSPCSVSNFFSYSSLSSSSTSGRSFGQNNINKEQKQAIDITGLTAAYKTAKQIYALYTIMHHKSLTYYALYTIIHHKALTHYALYTITHHEALTH